MNMGWMKNHRYPEILQWAESAVEKELHCIPSQTGVRRSVNEI